MLFKSVYIDIDCKYINEKSLDKCVYEKDNNNNIIKTSFDTCIFKYEMDIYKYLIKRNVIPKTLFRNNKMIYNTSEMKSLRAILLLNKNKKNTINETFSFINTFMNYYYVHGNLHIDNVFVDKEGDMYVIDYGCSYLLNKKTSSYKRRSYISVDSEFNLCEDALRYWDMFTMYISLSMYFEEEKVYKRYVKETVLNWIPRDTLRYLLGLYGFQFDIV